MSDVDSPAATRAPAAARVDERWSILAEIPEGITIQDAHGRLLFANDAAARLCGFPSAEAMLAARVEDWIGRFAMFDEQGAPLATSELPGRRVLAGLDGKERLIRFRSAGADRWSCVSARLLRGADPPLAINAFRDVTSTVLAERRVADELALSRSLQRVALALSSTLEHDALVQRITDEATALCGAQFGAFFHNVEQEDGRKYLLYTLSGAPREAFAGFGMPRATPVFGPTFAGHGVVRSDDIREDPRYGRMAPHHGMPKGHLPVVSYLAVPVKTADGAVLGGLFFGHPERGRFTAEHENAVAAIASHAAIALQNAVLFRRSRANEEHLAENERRLRLALAAGKLGTWEYDLVAGRVHWSAEIETMHGVAVGSFDGTLEAYQRDIHPDDRERVLATVDRNIRAADAHELRYRIVRPDGVVRWLEAHGTFLKDAAGRPTKLVGVCADVTDRIAAQDAEAALRIQHMLAGISDPFAVYDGGWRVVFVNEAGAALLGSKPSDLLGRDVWALVPDAKQTRFYEELDQVRTTRAPRTFEEYYAPLQKWFEVHAYPGIDGGVAVYSRDVSARRREQALQERLARYAALQADVGALLSRPGHADDLLRACCEALRERLDAAAACAWLGGADELRFAARAGTVDADALLARARADGLAEGRPAVRGEGPAYAAHPMKVDGKVVGAIAVVADAHLADDVGAALVATADALAQGVERRRAEAALHEHARELARSNADLEQFAYVASHDLQEPLRMVSSYVQLIERRYRDHLDADAREFIGFAVEGAARMRRLIEDLLAYSRVGTRGREFVSVDLGAVHAAVVQNLERAIEESGAVLTSDPLPRVVGDEGQLVQLMQNLLGNAIKFRGEAPPRVHVSARREEDEWIVSVGDNGIGVDPEYFERIFVIFQRLNAREKYPGTGMGLAIAKKIVERHGGRIWIDSAVGRGATISFTLPAAKGHAP